LQTLMHYLADKPYDAMAHLVLGYNLKFSGKPKEAEQAFRRVLEIDPASAAATLFLKALTEPAPAEKPDKEPTEDAAAGSAEPGRSDR
jgi:predicted TPR repeat methyltransferase